MLEKKKILFVINTLGHAGAETAMLELLNRLEPDKYEIDLLVILGQGELVHQLPAHIVLKNKNYCDASVLNPRGRRKLAGTLLKSLVCRGNIFRRMGYLLYNLAAMVKKGAVMPDKLLWRIAADSAPRLSEHYDLAVAYLEGAAAYYVADYVNADKKAAFVHIDYGQAGYDRKLDGSCYLKFDRIFAVSGEVEENFLKVYPECKDKVYVFHNLMNQELIRKRSEEPGGFDDNFQGTRLLTVGRLTWQKAYDVAIDAMKLLKDEGLAVRWYILGEGDQREKLEKKIERLGLQEDFLLLGAKENPYPYYRQADIYVHATRFEGKSIAIQEAQTLGCAILASDCSGNREQIIDGEDGCLCELTPEKIRDGIKAFLEHEDLRRRCKDAASRKPIVHEEEMQHFLELL